MMHALFFSLGCPHTVPVAPAADPVVHQLRERVIPISTVDPGVDADDLEPFGALVGEARVVALGEATHGTREFYRLKHRLFRYLVENRGFRVLGLEANHVDVLPIEAFIQGGEGEAAAVVHGIGYPFHDNESVVALVEWMRTYNQGVPPAERLHVHGLDVQYAPQRSLAPLLDYLTRVDPGLAESTAESVAPLLFAFDGNRFDTALYARLGDAVHAEVAAALVAVEEALDASREVYEAESGAAAWRDAWHHARLVSQIEVGLRLTDMRRFAIRDVALADNVEHVFAAYEPHARMVVSAHNGHVNLDSNGGSWASMGHLVHETVGDDYVALGFVAHGGAFSVRQDGVYAPIEPPLPPADSLDAVLARVGPDLFALDLRGSEATAAQSWLATPLMTRESDYTYREGLTTLTPTTSYDGIVFVRTATPTRVHPTEPTVETRLTTTEVPDDGRLGADLERWVLRGAAHYALDACDVGCAGLRRTAEGGWAVGRLVQRLDAGPLRNRRVTLTARLRAEVGGAGSGAQIALWAAGPRGGRWNMAPVLGSATMFDTVVDGEGWEERELVLMVPDDAETVTVSFVLTGSGAAWVDDVHLQAEPVPEVSR